MVLRHILRPFWTSIVRPRQYLSSAQALGLNIKWAGVINSLTPHYLFKKIYFYNYFLSFYLYKYIIYLPNIQLNFISFKFIIQIYYLLRNKKIIIIIKIIIKLQCYLNQNYNETKVGKKIEFIIIYYSNNW